MQRLALCARITSFRAMAHEVFRFGSQTNTFKVIHFCTAYVSMFRFLEYHRHSFLNQLVSDFRNPEIRNGLMTTGNPALMSDFITAAMHAQSILRLHTPDALQIHMREVERTVHLNEKKPRQTGGVLLFKLAYM